MHSISIGHVKCLNKRCLSDIKKRPTRRVLDPGFPWKTSIYLKISWIIFYFPNPVFFSSSSRRFLFFLFFYVILNRDNWESATPPKDPLIVVLTNIWPSRKGYSDYYLCFIWYFQNYLSRHHAIISYFSRLPNKK